MIKKIIAILLVVVVLVVGFVFIKNAIASNEPTPIPTTSPSPPPSQIYETMTAEEINALKKSDVVIACNDVIFCVGDVFRIDYPMTQSAKLVNLELWGVTKSGSYIMLERKNVVNVGTVKFEYEPKDNNLIGAFVIDDNGKTNTESFRFLTLQEMQNQIDDVGGINIGDLL